MSRRNIFATCCALVAACYVATPRSATADEANWLRADDVQGVNARWSEFAQETDPALMQRLELVLRGSIDDYLSAHPQVKVLARVTSGIVATTPQSPEKGWMLAQVKSVQGNDIVLGPLLLTWPVRKVGDERNWVYPPITLAFDETKHYAGIYIDRSNRIDTFAIYERRSGEPMPVAIIFTPREVPTPLLVTESENRKQRWLRGLLMTSAIYSGYEKLKRDLNYQYGDGRDVGATVPILIIAFTSLLLVLSAVILVSRSRSGDITHRKVGQVRDATYVRAPKMKTATFKTKKLSSYETESNLYSEVPPKKVQIFTLRHNRKWVLAFSAGMLVMGFVCALLIWFTSSTDFFVKVIGSAIPIVVALLGALYFRSAMIRRVSLLSFTIQGASTSLSESIPLVALKRFLLVDDQHLYMEMRFPPDMIRKEPQEQKLLHSGQAKSEYLWLDSDGNTARYSGRELVTELEHLRGRYCAARGLHQNESASPRFGNDVHKIFRCAGISFFKTLLSASVLLLVSLSWAWIFVELMERDLSFVRHADFDMHLIFILSALAVWKSIASLITIRLPTLIVDQDGLRHTSYGFLPWNKIRIVEINWIKFYNSDGPDYNAPVLCAQLTDTFFKRRLGWSLLQRMWLWSLSMNDWRLEFECMLPLIWVLTEDSKMRHTVNDENIPMATVFEVALRIQEFAQAQIGKGAVNRV